MTKRELTDAELVRRLDEAAWATVASAMTKEPTPAERAEFAALLESIAALGEEEEAEEEGEELRMAADGADEET